MGIFQQFPYSNFHEMNLDQIIKIMREMQDEWTATKAEWASYKDFIDNYFENLDVTQEVLAAMRVFAEDGTLNNIMDPTIAAETTAWLALHITQPTTPVIDDSLTVAGAAADAFAAGNIKRGTTDYYEEIEYTLTDGEYVDRTDGHFVSYNNWSRTDYLEVDPSKIYYVYGTPGTYNGYYDENRAFIAPFTLSSGLNKLVLANNVKYMVISKLTVDFPTQIWTSEFNKLNASVQKAMGDNVIPFTGWKCGKIEADGSISLSGTRLYSEYVEMTGGITYDINVQDATDLVMCITEYDENDVFLYQTNYFDYTRKYMMNPATAKVRFMIGTNISRALDPEEAFSLPTTMTLAEVPQYFKVMSYNVGHYDYGTGMGLPAATYNEKLTNYRRFFGQENIELIGFQEYDSRMDDANTIWATDALWSHYFPYERHTGSQSAIMSDKYMSWMDNKQLSTGRYYTEGYIFDGVYVMSVHLSVGAANAATRITEANEIISIAQQHDKYIIFGDFNPEPGEEDTLFALFTAADMNIANCGWFGKYYTWSSNSADFDDYDNPTGTLYYIDNIITSDNIEIYNAEPVPRAHSLLTSDHIPIEAVLKLR